MSSSKVDLNLVRVFLAIHESGSVSRAAKRLHLTQPSVSYALSRLRHLLDDPLFSRTREGMVPTYTANQLYHVFHDSISQIEEAISATRYFDPAQSTRRFRLALSDLGEIFMLPILLEELHRQAPNIELEVIPIEIDMVLDWLTTGKIDAAIGNLSFLGRNTQRRRLFQEHYSCLLNRDHPRIGDAVSLSEFLDERHIEVARFSGHHLVEDVLKEMGLERNIGLRIPHFSVLPRILPSGNMLACLPNRIAELFAEPGHMKVIDLPFSAPTFDVSLYWQDRHEDTVAQQWFCNLAFSTLSKI